MITYNPKDWFKLIFQFHKSDTFRILLPNMFVLGLFTGALVYFGEHYGWQFKITTMFHQILGFVLSMLLVFRINSAYDRWWEGRKLWGQLVNNTRNLMIKINAYIGDENKKDKVVLRIMITNFVFSLKDALKGKNDFREVEFVEGISKEEFEKVNHKPLFIAGALLKQLEKLKHGGKISQEQLWLMNAEVQSLMDIAGACERIRNTPIPYSYSLFLKKIVFIYAITMPVAFSYDFRYWAIPVVMFIFYAFASLEIISEEVEDPFGDDANDLPTQEIADKINANLKEICS